MNGIFLALLGTLITFSITTLGAAGVFFVKKEVSDGLQSVFLGFAGGVMIASSIWSMLIPGISFAEQNGQISWLVMAGGFLLGVTVLFAADFFMKKWYQSVEGKKVTLGKSTCMMIAAITIHNIPEGMAVGLAFALAAQHREDAAFLSGALILTMGIAIQNFPEGTAVALPLIKEGMEKKKAFCIAAMTAVVEPVAGVLAALFAGLTRSMIALYLAIAAGTMIYVVVEEIIPETHVGEDGKKGTLGFIVGFLFMMILDVALG